MLARVNLSLSISLAGIQSGLLAPVLALLLTKCKKAQLMKDATLQLTAHSAGQRLTSSEGPCPSSVGLPSTTALPSSCMTSLSFLTAQSIVPLIQRIGRKFHEDHLPAQAIPQTGCSDAAA